MILTVTLNPMLDKTVLLDRLRPGSVHRASAMGAVVGGKGVNVSRQLLRLGVETAAAGFAGGETGRTLRRMLREEGIPERFVTIAHQTREGVTYRESTGRVTAVFEPSHRVSAAEARELSIRCARLLGRARWLVCSGSSPCRTTDRLFAGLLREAAAREVATALDSYGRAFELGARSRPTILKANRSEYQTTFNRSVRTMREARSMLAARLADGVRLAILTDGPRPMLACTKDRCYRIVPPATRAVNATGSGDAMLAALIAALDRGWDLARSLAYGVAAGACNAAVWAVASVSAGAIAHVARAVQIDEF